jgi:hypothetical protein
MMEDLTKNSRNTNLTNAQHDQMLNILKKSNMPTRYIRNKNLCEKYKNLLPELAKPQADPAFETPKAPRPVPAGRKRRLGEKRDFMVDGYLEAFGTH